MLFCKILHNGKFIKELFAGNFTGSYNNKSDLQTQTQVLAVTEKSLELYDYIYDTILNMPFIESKHNQDLFFHIYDAKKLKVNNSNLIVLLTACGLILMKYSNEKNIFIPIISEIMNINCEERDKLINLKTDDKYILFLIFILVLG